MSTTDQELVERLHKYATDWRVRADDSKLPQEAASRLTSLSGDNERMAKALENCRAILSGEEMSKSALIDALEQINALIPRDKK